jgi:histidinol-phosphate aminotransferase
MAITDPGDEIIIPEPTYTSYREVIILAGCTPVFVPLDEKNGWAFDIEKYKEAITPKTKAIFYCNPNNPTGSILPAAKLRDFCTSVSKRTVVFCDEAYIDYVTEPGYPSMVEMVKKNANVIVSRTFSKVYGMAGIRIGYLVTGGGASRRP